MPSAFDLEDSLKDWLIELKGQAKSQHTLAGYGSAVRCYLAYCAQNGLPSELRKDTMIAFMANRTGQVSTARLQLRVLKIFARWLADEEGFDADPIFAVKPPKDDQKAVPSLTDDEIRRMIKACGDSALRGKRDRSILVLATETGLRASELLNLNVEDVDITECVLLVRRGKGGKGRRARFSPSCAALLNKYKRARRLAGVPAEEGPLFVSERSGRRLTYTGMTTSLKVRAKDAGVVGFHFHRAAVRGVAATSRCSTRKSVRQ